MSAPDAVLLMREPLMNVTQAAVRVEYRAADPSGDGRCLILTFADHVVTVAPDGWAVTTTATGKLVAGVSENELQRHLRDKGIME